MTRDDVIRLALEAGFKKDNSGLYFTPISRRLPDDDLTPELESFAALVAAHEREACAAICDNAEKRKWLTFTEGGEAKGFSTADCAAAIRSRGNNE